MDQEQVTSTGLREIGHAFVLNLDRRQDRLESFQEQARRAGLGAVERVAAVDGRELESSAEILHLFRGNDFGHRRGILGCALSHLGIWERVADSSWPHHWTAVFEDDVMFCRDFARRWNEEMASWIPLDGELVYLGGTCISQEQVDSWSAAGAAVGPGQWAYVGERVNRYFARPRWVSFGTYAYVISRRAARIMCRQIAMNGINRAIDHFLRSHWQRLEVFASVPLLCWGHDEGTDIQCSFESLF